PSHSGGADAAIGSSDLNTQVELSQDISTSDSVHYTLSFWLSNGDDTHNNDFTASWNGQDLLHLSNVDQSSDYTHYVFDVDGAAAPNQSALQFAAFNPSDYWRIDDVSVRTGLSSDAQDVADGTIAFTDADSTDTHTANQTHDTSGYIGTFSLDNSLTEPNGSTPGSIAWHFSLTNAALDNLTQLVTQSYNVEVADNHTASATQLISVTVGTNGSDNFLFNANNHIGADTIANFNTSLDKIGLHDFGFTGVGDGSSNDVANAITYDAAGNAVINLGTADGSGHPDTITIAGVTQSLVQQHLDQFVHLA
ncbi:MAG: VCBS domain-containing protein, partial [Pseudolabrys sp.]|nr:VCBS domain-containing protein [Pseudolabrys sp.]